jgi:hypothetical protein
VALLVLLAFSWLLFSRIARKPSSDSNAVSNAMTSAAPERASAPVKTAPRGIPRALAAAPAPSPIASSYPPDYRALETYLKERFPADWTLEKDELGRVFSISGGEIERGGSSAESAATLAQTIAPLLGIPADQLATSNLRSDVSSRSVSYDIAQVFAEYEVFDGKLRLISRKSDGAVYMINTELRHIQPFEPKINYGIDDAQRVIREKYGDRPIIWINLASARPVVWADTPPTELAWSFAVKFGGSAPDRMQVLVSTRDLRILLERSLLVN